MDSNPTPSPDAASAEPASPFRPAPADAQPAAPVRRIVRMEGHCPDQIDPLEAPDLDSAVHETRRLRHDGWTPDKMRHATCGRSVIVRVNHRGPFHDDRDIDLSANAAERIGLIAEGAGRVTLRLLARA